MAAGILLFIDFEMTGNVVFDLKHQRANDNAAAIVKSGFGHPENNHGIQ
jgi:hypothetical protein